MTLLCRYFECNSPSGHDSTLLPEVPFQQALERLAVPGFVAGHFMHGVVDGIQVQRLGLLGQLNILTWGRGGECLCLQVL